MRMEINLIGRTVDEATDELEKYLDRAFLAGLPRVRIIHGHGAGILRRGVRDFLKSHPHVATIAEAPQNEGGQGATLVELAPVIQLDATRPTCIPYRRPNRLPRDIFLTSSTGRPV